ncbi:hypothetical protein [Streptomyces sp. NPDC019937]|uniref:hypothetical protein n=1 Tax=Streptomyces sp. NPDC019937 TaxID=3154787 RepID=UPI0033C425CC
MRQRSSLAAFATGTWRAPVVLAHSTRLAMLLGAVICAIGWAASYVLAPETSGLTLADAGAADRATATRVAAPASAAAAPRPHRGPP